MSKQQTTTKGESSLAAIINDIIVNLLTVSTGKSSGKAERKWKIERKILAALANAH